MTPSQQKRLSKFLSLVLRHQPEVIGIELDAQGWASIAVLIENARQKGRRFSEADLLEVVGQSDKKRFAISPDGLLIRANQGHSIPVQLDLETLPPPEVLFHGTVDRYRKAIREQGLIKGQRHHVHLSPDRATAEKVGARRGRPVILQIAAQQMHADGFEFYRSANGVWLTDHVPVNYITFPSD